ncbi:MAG TPA: thiamine phosphate synthase [Terracidiphilus sp.]|jgi:thiamine-phosphate pyrophosphorylase|nr:thiamine phosphate synthase [Terracidiphilus sp.]
MAFSFPRIYPILDSSILDSSIVLAAGRGEFLHRLGSELAGSGVTLLEYRNKTGSDAEILSDAAILRAAMPAQNVKLILDDRVDLIERAGFDGVHVDAGDLSAAEARRLLGPARMVGAFGGSDAFLPGMLEAPADYLAIGPVYPTTTKQTSAAPIGVEGVRRLREQAGPGKILTAAAGITLESAPGVLAGGANAVAVAAAIFRAPNPAAEFRRWLAVLG